MSSVLFCTHLGYIALEFNSRDQLDHFPKIKSWITLKQTCVCWFGSWFPMQVTVWAEDAAKSVCFLPLAAGLAHWGPVYAVYSVEGNITDVMTCFTLSDFVCVFVCACRASWGRSSWVMSSLTLSFLAGSSTASWGRRCSTETTPWPAGKHTFPRVYHNSRPVGHQNF